MTEEPVVHLHLPVDASTGKLLYDHGDEVRKPRGFPVIDYKSTVVFAVEFLDRELTSDLLWNLAAHPLDAEKTYTLSGGCGLSADASPMFLSKAEGFNLPGDWPDGSDPDPALGRLTFRIAINDNLFAAIAGNDKLRKSCSMTVAVNSGSDSAVAARIPFHPCKRADESAGGSSGGDGVATTVNGLSGAVVLTDADGNAFETSGQTVVIETGGGGDLWDYSMVTWPAVGDSTFGRVRYLDAVYPELFFAEIQDRVAGFRALVVSNDNTVSGNMALIPVVATDAEFSDAIELPAQILAVGTSLAEISFDLEINRKFLKFRRDYENPLDTLADGDGTPITAIMINLARRISNA